MATEHNAYTGLTARLADRIHRTRYQDLGDECVARVKQAIADGIAVAVAGHDQPAVRIAARHVADLGAKPVATIWGHGIKTSVVEAARVNGMATHVLDFEPMWSPPTHSVSPTVPVAFALAEAHGASGRNIITAVARGLEIQGRLQYAGDQYVPEDLLFHPPGVAGVLGSAVVAATLLKLDALKLRHALGIAASRAGALLANIGSMTKCTHCGNAAAGGLDAALLARRGFTGNIDVLEAHKGVIVTFFPRGFDAKRLLGYGKPWRVVDPGLSIKMFPSQYATHFAITAGLAMHAKVSDANAIEGVRITGPVMEYINRPAPVSGLDGKFSLQYTAAAALLDGKVGIDTFSDKRRFKSDVEVLLKKITLTQDPAIPNDLHKMRVDIEARLKNGETHRVSCDGPKGTWGKPQLTPGQHRVKLEDCLSRHLPATAVARVLATLGTLERAKSDEVNGMLKLISGTRRRHTRRVRKVAHK